MKKALLSLCAMTLAATASADLIYSWESNEGEVTEIGGTIEYVNGDGNRLNYVNGLQSGEQFWTICLNGKWGNLNDEVASANAGHMVITFDQELKAGDEIKVMAYKNKGDETKKSSIYFLYENGTVVKGGDDFNDICEVTGKDENNKDITKYNGKDISLVTYTVPAEADGSKTLTLTRNDASTNLFITKLYIMGERQNAGTPWDIEGVTMNWMGESIAAGAEVDCLSYMYNIATDKEIAAGEGRIEFRDAAGNGLGVGALYPEAKMITFYSFGQTGYTTPGTYTMTIPAGAIVDAEGNPNAEYTATWTVKEQPAKTPWAISEVVMQWMGNEIAAGEEVWTLSYNYVVKGEKTAMSFGEGHVEFLDANGNGVQVASDINYGYLKFPFGETGYNVAGTYTLNIPAGALVDAEGNPCEAFTATWTVKEQVELGDCFGWYFNVAEDPFMGSISLGDLEACGLFVNFPEQKNVTPDMTAEVVYSVLPYAPEDIMPLADDLDDVDPGMGVEYPVFTATGDALFTGELQVCLVDAIQYIEDHGAGIYVIQVGSVKVFDGNMVAVYSWTPNEEEGELVATIVNVTENEPAEDPTAIQAIAAEKAAKMFNLQGQRVNAAKGMVVVNGKVNFVK